MCGRFISIGPTTIDEMYGGRKKLENRLNNLNVDRKVIRSKWIGLSSHSNSLRSSLSAPIHSKLFDKIDDEWTVVPCEMGNNLRETLHGRIGQRVFSDIYWRKCCEFSTKLAQSKWIYKLWVGTFRSRQVTSDRRNIHRHQLDHGRGSSHVLHILTTLFPFQIQFWFDMRSVAFTSQVCGRIYILHMHGNHPLAPSDECNAGMRRQILRHWRSPDATSSAEDKFYEIV